MQAGYFLVDGVKFRRAGRIVRDFADRIISMALRNRSSTDKDSHAKYSVVEELVKSTQDPNEIRD